MPNSQLTRTVLYWHSVRQPRKKVWVEYNLTSYQTQMNMHTVKWTQCDKTQSREL